MSKCSGYAYCDRCGRSVSYKTSNNSSSVDSFGEGCMIGCLSGCLAMLLKYLLIGGLIVAGIVILAIVIGIIWIFVT